VASLRGRAGSGHELVGTAVGDVAGVTVGAELAAGVDVVTGAVVGDVTGATEALRRRRDAPAGSDGSALRRGVL